MTESECGAIEEALDKISKMLKMSNMQPRELYMKNLFDLSAKLSKTGKAVEFIMANTFFDIIEKRLDLVLTKREKDAFYLLLVTKFRG